MLLLGARCLRVGFKSSHELSFVSWCPLLYTLALYLAAFALIGVATADVIRPLRWGGVVPERARTLFNKAAGTLWLGRLWTLSALGAVAWVVGYAMWRRWGNDYLGTDGALFARYATDLILQGQNPYAHSMQPAYDLYSANTIGTYRLDGSMVDRYSYPALALWAFLPQTLLGLANPDLTSLLLLAVTMGMLTLAAPAPLRLVPPLLLTTDADLVNFSGGGVFDIVWTLPLIVSMTAWQRGRLGLSGALFGIACAGKQTPWAVAPFLVLWLLLEARPWQRLAAFCCAAALAFLAVNAPFIVDDPAAWLRGVLVPLGNGIPLVQQGMGPTLISAAGFTYLPKAFFGLAALAALLVLGVAYVVYFERAKWLAWIAPMLLLWFNYRSLQNYYVFFVPVAFYAMSLRLSDRSPGVPVWQPRPAVARWALQGAAAVAVLLLGFGAVQAGKAQLGLAGSVTAAHDPDDLRRAAEIRLTLTNGEAEAITPTFNVSHSRHQTPFIWTRRAGPAVLERRATAEYVLAAPSIEATVPFAADVLINVYDARGRRYSLPERQLPVPSELRRVANPRFAAWALTERGIEVPFLWRATGDLAESQIERVADGVRLGVTADAEDMRIALTQSVRLADRLRVDVTPPSSPGCAAGIKVGRALTLVWSNGADGRDDDGRHIVDWPATPGQRMHADINLARLLSATELDEIITRPVDITLFAATAAGCAASTVTYHAIQSE